MLFKENGYLIGDSPPVSGKKLWIMGLSELDLAREIAIDIGAMRYVAGAMLSWGGDVPPKFALSWKLVAGFDHDGVRDRADLFSQIKLAHAFGAASGSSPNGLLKCPAKVRLVIPGHISCVGFLEAIRTAEAGPWDVMSGANLPTECTFSITMVPFQSYDPENIVNMNKKTWLSSDVLGKFYQ